MHDPTSAMLVPQGIWDTEVASIPETACDWIVHGFIGRRNMTLLTSLWKAGKTTLLAHLLAKRSAGQMLLDRPVAPGKTAVISEEPRALWADRCRQFNFGGSLCLFAQPFPHLPTAEQWHALIAHVGRLGSEHGIDLIVVDSLTHFLRAENAGRGVLDLLMPIRALTAQGMAALLMHHPRRCRAEEGSAGRGHGAIHTEVDISIEMRHAGDNPDSRARRFFCLSRLSETPRRFLFELNADGSDYTVLPDADGDGFNQQWDVLRMVLEDAAEKVTRQEMLKDWPADFPKPCSVALWKWLSKAVADGLVKMEGTGRKTNPFRYWLPATEERWRQNPLHQLVEKQNRDTQMFLEALRSGKAPGESGRQ